MNRTVILALALAVAQLIPTGCRKELSDPQQQAGGSASDFDGITVSIEKGGVSYCKGLGSEEEESTKTMLNSKDYICWCQGDKVWVNGYDASHTLTLQLLGSDSPEATVKGDVAPNASGTAYTGHYPPDADYWDTGTWNVILPETRTYNTASPLSCVPMFAESDNRHLTFKCPFGIMEFVFKGRKRITKIQLSCSTGNLSGTFRINSTGTAEFVSGGTNPNEVTLNFPDGLVPGTGAGAKVYLALAAGSYSNLKLDVWTDETDDWGGVYSKMVASLDVVKGTIYGNSTFDTDNWLGVLMWYPAAGEKGLYWSKYNLGATNGSTPQSYYGNYYCWAALEVGYSSITFPATGTPSVVMKTTAPETVTGKYPVWASKYTGGFDVWGTSPYNKDGTNYKNASNWNKYGEDGKTQLDMTDDVARVKWGNGWRIPTGGKDKADEIARLWASCGVDLSTPAFVTGFVEWKPDYPVAGMTSAYLKSCYTGRTLILPACGVFRGLKNDFVQGGGNPYCMYWTANLAIDYSATSASGYAAVYRWSCYKNGPQYPAWTQRYEGYCVRPVREL